MVRLALTSIALSHMLSFASLGEPQSADWFCKEEASSRVGNTVRACGVGTGPDENAARTSAFENARKEFGRLCVISSDCRGHAIRVEPERTSCDKDEKQYKCYRLLVFEIGESISGQSPSMPEGSKLASSPSLSTEPSQTRKTATLPDWEKVELPEKETFKPFYYSEIARLPKIKVGMPKKEALARFGKPSSVRESDLGVKVFYRQRPFCTGEQCGFSFDAATGKVTRLWDFRFEYTESLK